MSYDKRYYGIYEGFVQDFDDPENNGRVRLTVPQVTGEVEWTGWAPNAGGGGLSQSSIPYGTFTTSANQTVTAANTATIVNSSFVAQDANKMFLDNGKIYVEETGDYFLMFSAIFTKSNANTTTADLWLRKNGVNIPDSNTRVSVAGNNGETIMVANFILDLEYNDYIELVFSSPDANTKLTYYAASSSPTRPAVPGIIATLHLIGKYLPKPNQKVWVMYIGGDPNFPVWIGAQV
jgi:hypothetical protein